jgi:hypothetical protein
MAPRFAARVKDFIVLEEVMLNLNPFLPNSLKKSQ